MMKLKKADVEKYAAWLSSYAKLKPVNNYGGNFWGINRNRCTIIRPDMLEALVAGGFIVHSLFEPSVFFVRRPDPVKKKT